MIHPAQVSAVLVTKGDVDLSEILDSIRSAGVHDIVVWNNAERDRDLSCYGRYAGIVDARNLYVFHQDDDLIAPVGEILACYDPVKDDRVIVANNRPDESWPLTAMGTLFRRDLADCFQPYIDAYGEDDDFYRVSDVVFAYMNAYRRITVGYRDLPWAATPERMHLQPDHYVVRERARDRTLALVSGRPPFAS